MRRVRRGEERGTESGREGGRCRYTIGGSCDDMQPDWHKEEIKKRISRGKMEQPVQEEA